ncbi:MAG: hypothetical protein K0R39_3009 [Symbiobacteriaceae bacterium]|jgi:hypothetical protein|nr:hypothetical protein [Symbiobacteriaceae bacterium]
MAVTKHRRYLTRKEIRVAQRDDGPATVEALLSAFPEAARFTDEEAEDFLLVAIYLDWCSVEMARQLLQKVRIAVPAEIAFDAYRLGRHLFRHWGDPEVRRAVLARGVMDSDQALIARIIRRRNGYEIEDLVRRMSSPAFFAWVRQFGAPDLNELVWDLLNDKEQREHRTLVSMAKVIMHRLITEPEPPRRPTRWDQEKLARRLHLRDVQMRAMRKSVHHLRRERKALMVSLRERSQQERPELQALAAQLAGLRAARAAAQAAAAAELAEHAQRQEAELQRRRTELAHLRQDLAAGLAERQSWLTAGKGAPR